MKTKHIQKFLTKFNFYFLKFTKLLPIHPFINVTLKGNESRITISLTGMEQKH